MSDRMARVFAAAAVAVVLGVAGVSLVFARGDVAAQIDVAAQPLAQAIQAVARQTSMNILVDPKLVEGRDAPALKAQMSVNQALNVLLQGTGLTPRFVDDKTITLVAANALVTSAGSARVANLRLAEGEISDNMQKAEESSTSPPATISGSSSSESSDLEDEDTKGIPEILVKGSKILNTDIRRTEDDIQPYVIFDRERIESSSASNLEEFFRNELTMSASGFIAGQAQLLGNRSRVNLRGLGTDETLILIDGRRTAGVNFEGRPEQPDINGIPLARVERIEVLPTTASGIYGGGATGGVVNIVLRRDYAGFSAQLGYGNTFESDAATRRVDVSGGANFDEGRTNVLVAASFSDANPLLSQERDFVQRGRQHILDNNGGNLEALNRFGVVPPLGATPNIRSLSGNLVLDAELGGADLGSPITFVPYGYAGVAATGDSGAALVANAGRYNVDPANTAQQGGKRYSLLSAPEARSLIMTVRRELTPRVQLFADLQGSDTSTIFSSNFADEFSVLPDSAPNNPFQQTILVNIPMLGLDQAVVSESETHRAVAGLVAELPGAWQTGIDFTWSRSRSSYTQPPGLSSATSDAINTGSLEILRDINEHPIPLEAAPESSFQSPADVTLRSTSLRLAGPAPWSIGGGAPAISSLLEYREESLGDVIVECVLCGTSNLFPSRSQTALSAYLEARFPLVSNVNRKPGVELLEVQLAVRGDDYSVTGARFIDLAAAPTPIERYKNKNSSVDPTVGFRYQPMPDLTVRSSYGTGYLPPSMTQLVPNPVVPSDLGFTGITDPLRGHEPVGQILEFRDGGNFDLRPEESESLSVGAIFTPRALSGLRLAVDWSQIEKTNNIAFPSYFSQADFETLMTYFPERITREQTPDGSVGRITGLDATLINIAKTRIETADLALNYELDTGRIGTLQFSAKATRLFSLDIQAAPNAPTVQNAGALVNFSDTALKWRANATTEWTLRELTLGWRSRWFDSYFFNANHTVNPSQGSASVSSQMYHDLYGSYRFAPGAPSVLSFLADTEVRFGVNNVLNKKPPVDVLGSSTFYSRLGDPRLANYYVTIRKSFGE